MLILAPILCLPVMLQFVEHGGSLYILGLLAAIGIYVMSDWMRVRGQNLEKQLFQKWGGQPTTLMLFWDDTALSHDDKKRCYDFFSQNEKTTHVPTPEEQRKAPGTAKTHFDSLIKWLRENRRDNALVLNENAWYGFCRNVYASKWIGVALSVICALILIFLMRDAMMQSRSLEDFYRRVEVEPVAILAIEVALFILFVTRKEAWVKRAATGYARALLATCAKAGP
jgi:hypothetical protein